MQAKCHGQGHANAAVRPNITASTAASLGLRILVIFTTCLPPRRHSHDNAYRCPAALLARQKQAGPTWRNNRPKLDGVETVWRSCGYGVETHGDGVGADLMAKAGRGRVGTHALEKPLVRWMRSGEREPCGAGHLGATASRQAKLVIRLRSAGDNGRHPATTAAP